MKKVISRSYYGGAVVFVGLVIISLSLVELIRVGVASALTYQSSVDVEFHVNSYLDLYVGGNLTIDDLNPSQSGESSPIAVSVVTNSGYGYYLTATVGTSSTNTNLTHTTDGNYTFASLSSNAATLNAIPENRWGYSYSTDDGTTWISGSKGNTQAGYNGLPLDNDDDGATGVLLAGGDSFIPGTSLQFKIAAHASATQPSGTYTNVVNFYAVANPEPTLAPVSCAAGYICYNVNSLTQTEGTMGRQSAADGNTVQLFASNFSRDGYGFAGWSDAYDYATNPYANFYGPNEDITVPTGTTANGLSLYAVWIKSAGNLQDTAKVTQLCGTNGTGGSLTTATYNDEGDSDESTWSITANLSSISALTDTRDNQTYAIARLTDGNCWMIENLRLADKDSNNNDVILSSTNTNNPSLPLTNIYNSSATSNHLSPTSSVAYNATTAPEGWCTTNSSACDDQSRLRTDNTTNRVTFATTSTSMSSHDASFYSYGNYYNWYSATAGNGKYANGSGYTAPGDICPSGWFLPYGGSGTGTKGGNTSGGFYYLASSMSATTGNAINSKKHRHFPNNLLFSGTVSGASLSNRGSSGYFWSSRANDSGYAYNLYFGSSNVYPGTNNSSKYYGRTVRCIATSSE